MEETNIFEQRTDLSGMSSAAGNIRGQIGKLIVGQMQLVDLLITALIADGHVLIEGVPGVAKTLAAKLLARTVSVGFSRIQFTPDLMPSDVLGTSVFNVKTSDFEFRRGPIFSNIVLIDEINRAPAKTQSALFEVMEERQATIDGKTYAMGRPFMVIATQNPIEQEGTYRLPEAQLDRFLFKIEVDYPTLAEEETILRGFHARNNINDLGVVEAVISADDLAELRHKAAGTHVEDKLLGYIAQIVAQTRDNSALYLGGSPRASLAILTCAKAAAAIAGRDFVVPDDVKAMVAPVLRHRILMTPEKEMEGVTVQEVIQQILEKVEVPR